MITFVIYVVFSCALLGIPLDMDRTAFVYIARGELQRAEIFLQRATQRRTAIGAWRDALNLLSTSVLAVMQGRFEEGQSILEELVPGEDKTHLSGNTDSVDMDSSYGMM